MLIEEYFDEWHPRINMLYRWGYDEVKNIWGKNKNCIYTGILIYIYIRIIYNKIIYTGNIYFVACFCI